MKKRVLMSLSGVILCAISVAVFKLAALGVDPYQTMMSGLDNWLPISFGTIHTIVCAVFLVFALLTDRKTIGIATFLNLFLLGYITQYTLDFLQALFPAPSMVLRCVCLVIGFTMLSFSTALLMTAQLGVSTYDAVAIVLADKWHLAPFKYCRIGTDVACIVLGISIFLLSGGAPKAVFEFLNIGTVGTAFFMGPLTDFFNVKIVQPMLRQEKSQAK